jgi:hypothetical protein
MALIHLIARQNLLPRKHTGSVNPGPKSHCHQHSHNICCHKKIDSANHAPKGRERLCRLPEASMLFSNTLALHPPLAT